MTAVHKLLKYKLYKTQKQRPYQPWDINGHIQQVESRRLSDAQPEGAVESLALQCSYTIGW